jgi:hypothetical protein
MMTINRLTLRLDVASLAGTDQIMPSLQSSRRLVVTRNVRTPNRLQTRDVQTHFSRAGDDCKAPWQGAELAWANFRYIIDQKAVHEVGEAYVAFPALNTQGDGDTSHQTMRYS